MHLSRIQLFAEHLIQDIYEVIRPTTTTTWSDHIYKFLMPVLSLTPEM